MITLNEAFRELRAKIKDNKSCGIEFEIRNQGNYPQLGLDEMPENTPRWRLWDGELEKCFEATTLDGVMATWRSTRIPGTITAPQIDEAELMIREVV